MKRASNALPAPTDTEHARDPRAIVIPSLLAMRRHSPDLEDLTVKGLGLRGAARAVATEAEATGARRVEITVGDRFGDYVIRRPSGEAGHSRVFAVEHELSHEHRSLFAANTAVVATPGGPDLHERVIRTLARIRHENLPQVSDVIEIAGRPAVVVDLADGESLARVCNRGALDPTVAFEYTRQLCCALERLHDAGLAHGSIRPENCMITSSGRLVLQGIGMIWPSDAPLLHKHKLCPRYDAPELAFGATRDHQTAVFSTGVVLYELLTGKPLPVCSLESPDRKIRAPGVPRQRIAIELFKVNASFDLLDACLRATEVDRAKRMRDVRELRSVLDDVLYHAMVSRAHESKMRSVPLPVHPITPPAPQRPVRSTTRRQLRGRFANLLENVWMQMAIATGFSILAFAALLYLSARLTSADDNRSDNPSANDNLDTTT